MSAIASMLRSEDVGVISKSSHPDDRYWWTLPHCFAYTSKNNRAEMVNCIVCSPCFISFDTKWRIAFIGNGYYNDVGLFLWKVSTDCCSDLNVKLGIIDHKNHPLPERSFSGDLNSYECFGRWDFVRYSELSENRKYFAPDGLLRVFCELKLKTDNLLEVSMKSNDGAVKNLSVNLGSSDNNKENIPEPKGVDRLVLDLKSLLLNEQTSDVTLKVEDREFKAHRSILIARSPVFASMLQHDTKENNTGVVDIPDCSAETFKVFLSYIYTGSADDLSSENVFDLYYAADKYQINDLKSECAEYMVENLSTENFCAVMTLSLLHNESGLQKKARKFFCDNVKIIIKTVQWQEYVKDYPEQANELFVKVMNA